MHLSRTERPIQQLAQGGQAEGKEIYTAARMPAHYREAPCSEAPELIVLH